MTTAAGICQPTCEFCDKNGLPLLTGRYAIATQDGGAPKASGPSIDLKGKSAQYTIRLVRKGYVYLYDEARDRWECWYVTPDGYYFKLDETPGKPPAMPTKPFNCKVEGHAEVASCLTVRDPKHATNVWLGFSDVRWTDEVRKKHQSAAYRKRHMRVIDVQAAMKGSLPEFCKKIGDVGKVVAEYAMPADKAMKAFRWGPFQLNWRADRAAKLVEKCDQLRPKQGLIVVLEDPVGIARELAVLAQERLQSYVDDTKVDKARARKLAVSSAISQLASAVRTQAELEEIAAAESLAQDAENGVDPLGMDLPGVPVDPNPELAARLRNVTAADLERAGERAWARYAEKYSEKERSDWQKAFDKALEDYTQSMIQPLGDAHAKWMESEAMAAMMECNYDPKDIRTGATYTETALACVTGTAGLKSCYDLYHKWVSVDGEFNPKNIILRALIFNNDEIGKAVKEATELDKRSLPWDNVYGPYKIAIEKIGKGHADQVAKLLVELTGPIAKTLGAMFDGPAKVIIGIMSLHAGKGWARITIDDSRKNFRKYVLDQVIQASDKELNRKQVKAAVDREIRRLEIHGEKTEGKKGAKWIVLLDEEGIAGLPKDDIGKQKDWLKGRMRTVDDLNEIRFSRFRSLVNTDVRMGVVSGILQIAALTKLYADEQNALAADKNEARWRMGAGVLAVGGSVLEIAGAATSKLPRFTEVPTQGLWRLSASESLALGGRVLGAVGGLIMAVWDARKAYDEGINKKNWGVGALYLGSAVLGGIAAIGFFMVWNPLLMIVLVAALVIVTLILEKVKDNKLQTWLEQCVFGKGQRYGDAKLEMDEFALALK